MATNNALNSIFSNNTDGFTIGGGTTSRSLTVTGGNLTLSTSGSNTYTFPAATDTLVGRASTDTLTNKTLTTPLITGSSSVASTPANGLGTLFGVGTGAVRPHWINSSGTDEVILTDNGGVQYIGYQSLTTNSTPTRIKVQSGWSYFQGNSTNIVTTAITFPTAFSTILNIQVNLLGAKNTGGAPTLITDFTVTISPETPAVYPKSLSTTGFTATMTEGASNPSTVYYGFQWFAYGT